MQKHHQDGDGNTLPATISFEEYQEKVKNLRNLSDVTDFAKSLIAPTLQKMLEAELENHLGYKKHDPKGRNTGNSRNGHSSKVVKTSFGQAELQVPRDRNGSYEPLAVKKYETVQSDVEERIIGMYAKGMTTRDIAEHMKDVYGVDVSSGMVSMITDRIAPLISGWQSRPLSPIYPFVYLDGIYFKVRVDGRIVNRSAYVALGINLSGIKEVLGIWIGQTEGAKFWLGVMNELKNRGVEDVFIASIDGLSGFGEAIRAVFPDCDVQQCIVHQVRNTIKYIPHKDRKAFVSDLRSIYTATTEEAGLAALEEVKRKWPKYALYLKSWEAKWDELSPFFAYHPAIRRIMYTTNAVESLNHQLRKVTKTTTIFPHDDALLKLLFLAQRDVSKKWTTSVHNWGEIIAQFAVLFPEKVKI